MKDIVKGTLTGIILVFCVVFALMIQTNAAESDLDKSDYWECRRVAER